MFFFFGFYVLKDTFAFKIKFIFIEILIYYETIYKTDSFGIFLLHVLLFEYHRIYLKSTF